MKITKLDIFIIFAFMLLGALLRSYKIHAPLADWHSWRQADTASVAREYVKHGIDLLHPRYHDLSSIPSGKDNPHGYRFVEFPLLNALHALLYTHFPQVGFVEWGRLLTILASTLTIALLYLLALMLKNRSVAIFSAGIFTVLPYNIFYGRVILPEPFLVLFSFASLLLFILWLEQKSLFSFLFSLFFFSLALLMKPTALVLLLPLSMAYFDHFPHLSRRQRLVVPISFFVALLPLILWRLWMAQFPAGIPANTWLFNGNGIRFKGAFFRWIFGERIAKLILGYWGLVFVGLGVFLLDLKTQAGRIFSTITLGSLTYLVIIATGNVQHDYYQIQIVPALAFLYGLGADWLLRLKKGLAKLYSLSLILALTTLSLALSWYEVRGYFNINNPAIVHAGQKVDEIVPPDALVIAPYMGDTAFLFQTNRRGWPIGGDIDFKIKSGASYYVTTSKDKEYQELKNKYPVIFENNEFAILKLTLLTNN